MFYLRTTALSMTLVGLAIVGIRPASAQTIFQELDGLLVIEAENFHSKANTTYRDWYIFPTTSPTPTPDPDGPHAGGTGNGKYVEVLPDSRVTHDDPLEPGINFFETGQGAPRMNYQVNIITPGRYYARLRAYCTGTEDNSAHIGVNNSWPLSGTAVQWCDGKNSWYWSGARRVPEDHCGITNGIYLDLTAGQHTIMIAMREDGFELDRFLLTTNSAYFPTGVGPDESPHTPVIPPPPQFSSQPPPSVNAYVGDTITLSVVVTGAEPMTYQWLKDGVDLEGGTDPTLTWMDTQIEDSGTYKVRVGNVSGTIVSDGSAVTVSLPPPTVWGIVESNSDLGTLRAAVEAAGLVATFDGEDPLTLFAPHNAAFEALPEGALDDLLAHPDQLLALLTYHTLAGSQTAADLQPGNYVTLQGSTVAVSAPGGALRVNDATVVLADTLALNGVMHVIDTVLQVPVPPSIVTPPEPVVNAVVGDTVTLSVVAAGDEPIAYQWTQDGVNLTGKTSSVLTLTNAQVSDSGTYAVRLSNAGGSITSANSTVSIRVPNLWDLLERTGELSTFRAAMQTAGWDRTLQSAASLTLLGPSDAAFAALPAGLWDSILADQNLLFAVLSYHAITGTWTTTHLVPGFHQTIEGSNIIVTEPEPGVLMINEAEVIQADLPASNGVVHVLDSVLLLPEPALILTQPAGSVNAFVGDTIALSVEATGLGPVYYQWTRNGEDLEGETAPVFLKTDAQVTDSGTYAVNVTNPGGTITSRNAVVTVPSLWQILESMPDLSMLKTAVETAGLVETLEEAEALTVFAPNNAAFAAMPEGALADLLSDPDQLLTLLTYHALAGTRTALGLEPGNYVTLQGATVAVTTPEGTLRVNDATVILADTLASNGVLHVIDTVLKVPVPPTIVTPPAPNVSAYVGDTVTLSVVATGDEPLAYQWTRDGVDLVGKTGPTLTLTHAQESDSGIYAVRLSNAGGSLTSPGSVLTVVVPPPVLELPSIVDGSITISWAGGGELEIATDVNGPWVGTGNTSGWFVEPAGGGNRYFRIHYGQ